MDLQNKIEHFSALGKQLTHISKNLHSHQLSHFVAKAQSNNPWFTDASIAFALAEIGKLLNRKKLLQWLSNYSLFEKQQAKTIGLILAGNIPLVGFHDILCTLFSGNRVLAKLSSKDQDLYQLIFALLTHIEPAYAQLITFTDTQLKNIDAIIATGSNNSARYFEHYFSKYPHIIRKNRNSVAILSGHETDTDYEKLGEDIFTYFGLGCRNVSFLLVPEGFDFNPLMLNLEKYTWACNHIKYAHNYDYQRAILLMNQIPIYDNGAVILRNQNTLSSPIGVVNYQFYNSKKEVQNFINSNTENIQCIISKTKWDFPTYSFGEAQKPKLWDYADNVDTLQFLLDLK